MPRKEYSKLVRDKIPDIIAKNGGVAQTHTIDRDDNFCIALYEKLHEEFQEFLKEIRKIDITTSTIASDAMLEELADIAEVLHAIIRIHGLTPDAVDAKRLVKRHERGGFEKRIYLEYVDEEEREEKK